MKAKSILGESEQVRRASELIRLGARLQLLQSETSLSYERLLRLYKEIEGRSPPKGMLPFSTDWFMTWQPNVHASLFHNIYEYVNKAIAIDSVDALARAYQLYLEQIRSAGLEAVLSVTRAWRLVSFIDAGMLTTARCTRCGGRFVVHTYELTDGYVCGLCAPPSRAGKTRASRLAH